MIGKRASTTMVAVFPSSSVLAEGDRKVAKRDPSKRGGRGELTARCMGAVVIGGLLNRR